MNTSERRNTSELTDTIKIDFTLIPDHVRDDLCRTILDEVRAFKKQPGGEEALQAKIRELKASGRL